MNNTDFKAKQESTPGVGSSDLVRRFDFNGHLFSVSVSVAPSKQARQLYPLIEKCPKTASWFQAQMNKETELFFDGVFRGYSKRLGKIGTLLMKCVGFVSYGWKSPNVGTEPRRAEDSVQTRDFPANPWRSPALAPVIWLARRAF